MKKLKRQGKRIAVSILTVAFALTGSVTSTALQASEVSTQSIISEGAGYTFDVTNKKVTITSNEGTSNWRDDVNVQWVSFTFITNIETVVIKDGVTEIKEEAFSGCTTLTSVTIPNSVETIGKNAFRTCEALTSITIPNRVKTIGEGAFYNCIALISVTIPNSVETIEDKAFSDCGALTSVTIPDSVKTIGKGAFSNTWLTGVTIPDSVKTIGKGAFSSTGLTSVTIPDSVEAIGESAFYSCGALTNVTIPDSVKTIGESAFEQCTNLTNLTMSSRVTSIGEYAFSSLMANLTLTMTGVTPPTLGSNVFANVINLTIKVPKGTGDVYKGATGWDAVTNIDSIVSETTDNPRYSGTPASTLTVKESTHNQVTLDTITVANETVEYGISTTNDVKDCTWQDSPIFASLNENTTYYFFARVKANATHPADTVTAKVQVKTKEKPAESKLEEAKAIAVKTINDFVVTNDTEENELLVQLHADMQSVDGVSASWKVAPTIVKATMTTPGSMHGTIVLTENDKTVEIEVNKVIRSLNGEDSYNVVTGKDASWDKESSKDLVFTIDADHTKCKGIKIDGKEVLSGNYTITKGSTVVTLMNEYLKTLSVGTHEVTVVFEGREVKVSFSIVYPTATPSNKVPSTNDSTSNRYMTMTGLSGAILATSLYRRKKERNK